MRTFEQLKKHLRWIGVLESDGSLKGRFVSTISVGTFSTISTIYVLTTTWYFLFTAETFKQYAESALFVASSFLDIMWYFLFRWQRKQYDAMFVELDAILDKREKLIQISIILP